MKLWKIVLVLGLMGLLPPLAWAAEDKPAAPGAGAPPAAPKDPKQLKENMSYAIGMSIGNNIKRGAVDLDLDVLTGALKDIAAGKEPKLTDQQAQEALQAYQQESRTKREEERKKTAEKNKEEGQKFLAENKNKPGVKTIDVTLPDGTKAEMEYKVITEGSGAIPKSNDTVSVNYKGTLTNGKEFDSSAKRGQPAKFQVNRVVKGWTEALERMKVGSKWELYIPSSLAYGDFGSGPVIEPGSTLVFEVELLGIEAPQAPPTPQPLTSDIIKVPSAEELKKGAKIEVLKPEDVEKELKAATNKPAKKD
jgi:FKBP-type peptidyl-prolyl cis-trans isomerase FklB